MKQQTSSIQREPFLHRQPVASYFVLTFAVSWIEPFSWPHGTFSVASHFRS
jgi:hypothetical protein